MTIKLSTLKGQENQPTVMTKILLFKNISLLSYSTVNI